MILTSAHGNRLAAQLSGESQCSRDGSVSLQGHQGHQLQGPQAFPTLQSSQQGLGVPNLHHPPRTPPLYEEAVGERENGRAVNNNPNRANRLQSAVQAPSFTSHNNHSWGRAPAPSSRFELLRQKILSTSRLFFPPAAPPRCPTAPLEHSTSPPPSSRHSLSHSLSQQWWTRPGQTPGQRTILYSDISVYKQNLQRRLKIAVMLKFFKTLLALVKCIIYDIFLRTRRSVNNLLKNLRTPSCLGRTSQCQVLSI